MSNKLAQLLSYLDRRDVVRLRFRAGEAVMLETTTRAHPVTVTPLDAGQIRKFFAGTSVAGHIAVVPAAPESRSLQLVGKQYTIDVHGVDGKLAIDVAPAEREDANVVRVIRDETPVPRPPPHGVSTGAIRDEPSAPRPGVRAEYGSPARSSRARTPSPRNSAGTPAKPIQDVTPIPRDDVRQAPRSREPQLSQSRAGVPQHTIRDPPSNQSISGAPARPILGGTPPPPPEAGAPRGMVRDPPSAQKSARTRSDNRGSAGSGGSNRTAPPRPERPAEKPAEPRPPQRAVGRPGNPMLTAELHDLLERAVGEMASDIHIVAEQPVRVRKVGALLPTGPALSADHVADLIKPLLELRHHEQVASRGYTDLSIDMPGAGRFRLNVSRQRTGLKACFRVVQATPLDREAVGLPHEVERLLMHHQGLVIISGPNGHGKTTSMAAILDLFNNTRPVHIITVEDPVEILHPIKQAIVTQREVGTHTKSFSTALTAALREDPDVIAIGELRDRETVEMALQASETGHLVVATMSTPSGAKTIDRMIDMFPPDDQAQVRASLAGALKFIISQRLVRNADGDGRVAAFEMITGNVPLWALIRDKKLYQLPSLMQRGRNFGMLRLDESLAELVQEGRITQEEARINAQDPKLFGGGDA